MRVESSNRPSKEEKTEKAAESTKTEKKRASKKNPAGASAIEETADNADVKVKISSKAKSADAPTEAQSLPKKEIPPTAREEKDLKEAESLMKHINSGKLGGDEQGLALKRVGEIIKKYGTA